MIQRISKNGKSYWCKTGRRRGEITRQVLLLASRGQCFTRLDLALPLDQAKNRLWQLARSGQLRVIRRGINGPHGQPTVYQRGHINPEIMTHTGPPNNDSSSATGAPKI